MENYPLAIDRDKGTPPKIYKVTLKRSLATCNIDYRQWTTQATNRTNWRRTVYQATTSFETTRIERRSRPSNWVRILYCGVKTMDRVFHSALLQLTQCMNGYLAVDGGVRLYEHPSRINCSIAECFPGIQVEMVFD